MKVVQWYEQNAATVIPAYESLKAEALHGWLLGLLLDRPSLVLDIGAGSGRDAAWLAAQGHTVVAVEPAAVMRAAGQQLHPDANIRWLDDRLPALQNVHRLGMTFDFILVSAVWMHLPLAERTRAFRKVITLLKPGGLLAITLRHGAADDDRELYYSVVGRNRTLGTGSWCHRCSQSGRPRSVWSSQSFVDAAGTHLTR